MTDNEEENKKQVIVESTGTEQVVFEWGSFRIAMTSACLKTDELCSLVLGLSNEMEKYVKNNVKKTGYV